MISPKEISSNDVKSAKALQGSLSIWLLNIRSFLSFFKFLKFFFEMDLIWLSPIESSSKDSRSLKTSRGMLFIWFEYTWSIFKLLKCLKVSPVIDLIELFTKLINKLSVKRKPRNLFILKESSSSETRSSKAPFGMTSIKFWLKSRSFNFVKFLKVSFAKDLIWLKPERETVSKITLKKLF